MEILLYLPTLLAKLGSNISFIRGCIHIGAHTGQEYPVYKQFGIKNLLFYEPLPENFRGLKETVGNDQFVDLRNVALGNTSGTIDMFLEPRGLSSSILKPGYHLQQYPQIVFDKTQTVRIARLDDEQFDRNLYNFMNIDVQGYELEVLKGAQKTLEHIDLILAEINVVQMYQECPLVGDIDNFLAPLGFKRIATYLQQDGGTWGDALYLKVIK